MTFSPDNMSLNSFKAITRRLEKYSKQNPASHWPPKHTWFNEAMAVAFGFGNYHEAEKRLSSNRMQADDKKDATPSDLSKEQQNHVEQSADLKIEDSDVRYNRQLNYINAKSYDQAIQYFSTMAAEYEDLWNVYARTGKEKEVHHLVVNLLETNASSLNLESHDHPMSPQEKSIKSVVMKRIVFLLTHMNDARHQKEIQSMIDRLGWSKHVSLVQNHAFLMNLSTLIPMDGFINWEKMEMADRRFVEDRAEKGDSIALKFMVNFIGRKKDHEQSKIITLDSHGAVVEVALESLYEWLPEHQLAYEHSASLVNMMLKVCADIRLIQKKKFLWELYLPQPLSPLLLSIAEMFKKDYGAKIFADNSEVALLIKHTDYEKIHQDDLFQLSVDGLQDGRRTLFFIVNGH